MKIHSQPMDLRDYFATAAMQGYCQNLGFYAIDPDVAKRAYEMADTMIAERESGSCESVDSTKQKLVEAINRKHSGLTVSVNASVEQLIFHLETGLPF
ncbi:hypothetical protein [Acinetobacter baumannii]